MPGLLFLNKGKGKSVSAWQQNKTMAVGKDDAGEVMIRMSEFVQWHTRPGFRWVISGLHALLPLGGGGHGYRRWHVAWHCCCCCVSLHTQHSHNDVTQCMHFNRDWSFTPWNPQAGSHLCHEQQVPFFHQWWWLSSSLAGILRDIYSLPGLHLKKKKFEVEISLHTQILLFIPGSVCSGSVRINKQGIPPLLRRKKDPTNPHPQEHPHAQQQFSKENNPHKQP